MRQTGILTIERSCHYFNTACGLYYLAELIEEYINTTKRVVSLAIKVEFAVHALLLVDRLPLRCLALGVVAHIAYLRLLRRFPYIQPGSGDGLLAIVTFLVSNGLWIHHFWRSYHTVEFILAFLLATTWLVPSALFLGMAGEQSVLPGAGGYPYSTHATGSTGSGSGQRSRRGLALRVFDVLRRKRDEVLPDVVAKLPGSAPFMPKEKI